MFNDFLDLKKPFTYRRDVDGLRALAVLPVILFHAGLGFPGGYVGVDIFFVISGYLITSIVIRDILNERFHYADFWERRIRRIFPAALFVTAISVLFGAFALLPDAYRALGKAAMSQLTMVANFYFWQQDGYFAGPSDLEPLLHMWSLAVEEQYYLLFPFLLVTITRRKKLKAKNVVLILTLLSLAWSIYGVIYYQMATFYLLPARAWELLLGSLLALSPMDLKTTRLRRNLLALTGLSLIGSSFFSYNLSTPFPGAFALPPCIGTALLIIAHSGGQTKVSQLLSLSPVVFVGRISFSLYLWHWPLLVYARHLSIHELSITSRIYLLLAAVLLSILTWRWIETPFRKKQVFPERKQLFRFFGLTTLTLIVGCSILYQTNGLPSRFRGADIRFAETNLESSDGREFQESWSELPLLLPDSQNKIEPFLIWGDSHARGMVSLFKEICEFNQINAYYACRKARPSILGVNFLPNDRSLAPYNDRILELIDHHQIKRVFLINRWAYYINRGKYSRQDPLSDRDFTGRPSAEVFRDGMMRTIEALKKRGIEVVILKQPPLQTHSPTSSLWMADRFGYDPHTAGVTIQKHRAYQSVTNAILDSLQQEGVALLDPLTLLSHKNGHTKVHENDEIFYRDTNHLSKAGAVALRPLFSPFFSPPEPTPKHNSETSR